MADHVLELADKLWRGELSTGDVHPVTADHDLDEVAPGVAFIHAFGNISAFTVGDELLLVDTGNSFNAQVNFQRVRGWTDLPLTTAIYTHGHIDHVFGLGPYEQEAVERGRPRPHVVAHRDVPRRFDRYVLTAGYNGVINARQFKAPGLAWPTDYRYPDRTYDQRLDLTAGGERFELHHALGETDDHTWVWLPGRRILCTGDMFIWASPNCGNPQKVQRYPREWALALREMAALRPELLLPGHGWPIVGADRVARALGDTADLLDSLVAQTLALMNEGARLDEVLRAVRPPADLLDRPYLRPVYDEPEFVVRSLWRLYGGWYDGNPATLKPASEVALAREIAALAGGAGRLAERAGQLAARAAGGDDGGGVDTGAGGAGGPGGGGGQGGGDKRDGRLRLAGHLAELAALAAPDDPGVHQVRAEVFGQRAAAEISTMARGIFSWAADDSRERAGRAQG